MEMSSGKSTSSESSSIKKPFYVLIVDDNNFNRYLNKQIVRATGGADVKVEEAVDGVKAIEKVTEFGLNGISFDLILMDCQMPNKDGIEATKELMAMKGECPIIGVSTCEGDEKQKFLESGIKKLSSKPLKKTDIVEYFPGPAVSTSSVDKPSSSTDKESENSCRESPNLQDDSTNSSSSYHNF